MNKRTKIILIVVAVAVAGYLAFRWYQNRNAAATGDQSPTGGLGTNLNSVAPELVGGSAGPAVGPALSAPININLTEQVAPPPEPPEDEMLGANSNSTNPLRRQNDAASNAGSQPVKTGQMSEVINPGETVPGEVIGQPKPATKSGVAETEKPKTSHTTRPTVKSQPGKRFTEPEKLEK